MKTKYTLLLLVLFSFSFSFSFGQGTIFSENMGTPSGTTPITSNTFQNAGILSYSNGGQSSAEIRTTSASGSYTGASGGGNVYFTSTTGTYGFAIEGINAAGYTSMSLQFGYKKESASVHATLSVEYWNGSSWQVIANTAGDLFNEASGASAVWYLSKSLALPTGAQISGLKLRWVKTGGTAIRIDDVKLTGYPVVPVVTNSGVSNITATSAAMAGEVTNTNGISITANGSVYAVSYTNSNPMVGGSGVTTISTSGPGSGTGTFSNATGSILLPNVRYAYNAYATNSAGIRGYGTVGFFYTLAVTPGTPTISNATGNSLSVTLGSDTNSAATTYCIVEATTSKYVQWDGTLGVTPYYQTKSSWGTQAVHGLLPTTTYTFAVKAKNGDGLETSSSTSASGTTLVQPIVVSGALAALNTVYGTASGHATFTVSADGLTNDLEIAAPYGFELSRTAGGTTGYAETLTLLPDSGAVEETTIYVRLASMIPAGDYAGDVVLSSGIYSENVPVGYSSVAFKDVTISGVVALNKGYNGNTTATLGGTPSLNGILSQDAAGITLDAAGMTAHFSDAAIGTGKTVTVDGYFLNGLNAENYNLIQPTGLTADITGSNVSNIVLNPTSPTSTNEDMDYMNYQGTSLSSTSNSNGVMGFRVRDGGATANDADNLPTELTAITFSVTNAANLRCARIFSSNSPKGSVVFVPAPDANGVSLLTFTGLTELIAPDDGDLPLNLRVTFNSAVTDNQQMVFKVVSATAKSDGSLFALPNGGGATSLTTGNINRILVDADRLAFAIQPNDTYVGSMMNPAPVVKAVDAFGNTDVSYSGTVSLSSTGTLSYSPQVATLLAGMAYFNTVAHTATGSGFILTATLSGLTGSNSTSFSIDSNNPNDPNDPTPGENPDPDGISSTPSYHDTQGKLNISSSGQATYTLPIALPPSIADVGPSIDITYSSGQTGGIAGQGWTINSISYISRVATRFDIDGFKDGVDFDDNDKLALDGQRLLVKSGSTYWADGSLYETEVQSNSKIQLMGSGSNIYFIVTSPDGARSWYGNYGGMNATDLSAYYIVRYEDVNGNFILYNYGKPLNKTLCIDNIQFSANTVSNATPLNYIKFNYTTAKRTENAYFKATLIEKAELLNKVKVYTNGNLFKEYRLTHAADSQLGYQRVTKIQEFNGAGEGANPVVFQYNTTPDTTNEITTAYTDTYAPIDAPQLSGDFDGDGRMDIISNNKLYRKTFLSTATPPVTLPSIASRKFAGTIVKDNKLNQSQSIIGMALNIDSMVFSYFGYNPATDTVTQEASKTITMDNTASCSNACEGSSYSDANWCNDPKKKTNATFMEGDFDGDGITEVIVATFDESYEYGIDPQYCIGTEEDPLCLCSLLEHHVSNTPSQVLMVDLDTSAPTTLGSAGVALLNGLAISRSTTEKRMIGDYNGDGKSDVLVIKGDKSYKVYSFNRLDVSPWVTVDLIGQGTFESYTSVKPFLQGDFNGDGKPDIMIPVTDGECVPEPGYTFTNSEDVEITIPPVVCPNVDIWDIYYGNPNPAGGVFFTKKPTTVANYIKIAGDDIFSYFALDVNRDGKSDLLRASTAVYGSGGFFTPNNRKSRWRVSTYVNNIGNGSTSFINNYSSPSSHVSEDNSMPIPMAADVRYRGLSSDFVMIRYHGNNSFDKKITYIDFLKDVGEDNSLKKIVQSNGAITDEITYQPMRASENNGGFGLASDFYSSNNSVDYPAIELKQVESNNLVSQIKNTTLGVVRYQDFRYNGYIVKLDGVGSVGFKKNARTAWYISSGKMTWAVTEIDPALRGATKLTYTMLPTTSAFSFPASLTIGLMNKTENTFATSATGVFPYAILLQNQKTTDYITGIVNETIYDSYDAYNLPTSVTNKKYTGTVLQGSTTTVIDYDAPSFGTGSNFFIGRPHKKTITANAYGTIKKASQTFSYLNGNVSQIDSNVYEPNGVVLDPVTMVEKMTYYPNGLLKDKEISAAGTTTANEVSARKTSYTYDPTNRFVITTTDPEMLVSTNSGFHPLYGTVLVATNPFNQSITSVYDNWGKKTSVTDNTLNVKTNYNYTRTNNTYTTTITKTTTGGLSDGSGSIVDQDVLGREIRKGTKSLNGTWTYVATEYDAHGRKWRISEPYFGSTPSQWTFYEYDDYSRPKKTTSFTGKVVNTVYNGLTVTVSDSVMSKSKTIDSNGQITATSETAGGTPVGVITYKYDAGGNLLESDYEGVKTILAYDNWGRKHQLQDTSAGTYIFEYDAYNQIKKETGPKGITTYTYDGLSGRLLTKSVQGLTAADGTNIVSSYVYNSTNKLLESVTVTNPNDGNSTLAYTYDSQLRLYKTEETQSLLPSGTAVFIKQLTFDNFSRKDTETNTATAFGKTSSKTIKHGYSSSNGSAHQLKDNATSAVLWQANSADARGNILTAALGNGIAITNTFDPYGYASQFQHKLGTVDVMKLNTVFEPILGNLSSRYNSMFDMQENFTYDALDRLTVWEGTATNLLTLPFDTTTDGFTFSGTSAQGSVSNFSGKLKVTLKDESVHAGRDLNITVVPGDKLHIKGDISNKTSLSNTIAKLVLVETDVNDAMNFAEFPILTVANGSFDLEYIASGYFENASLSLKFVIEQDGPPCPICPTYGFEDAEGNPLTAAATFYLDNLKIDQAGLNSQEYDNRGRITSNKLGEYNYGDTNHPYQNNSITMTSEAVTYYTGRPQQDVKYNAFKAPITIEEQDIDLISFGYNVFQQRSIMYYGNTSTDKLTKPYRRLYNADGSMEITATFAPGNNSTPASVEFLTYIGGTAYTAPVVLKSDGASQNYFYLHRDYQGSVLAVTDATGAIVEKRLFDPWGGIIKVEDGAGNALTKLTFFDRGYTGHEHLESVGLINMNARLYDPKLHRFLQPDTYVQDPYNTQNHNRYGYCLNNPLKYTDVTGDVFNIATLASCIPVVGSIFASWIMKQPVDWGAVIVDAVMTGVSITVTCGIGEAVATIGNFYTRAAVQALAHAAFQGGLSSITGGKFWAGFASGALSSIAASALNGGFHITKGANGAININYIEGIAAQGTVGTLAFSAIAGGAGSAIGGGNFWKGAVTGLIVAGFNHLVHDNPNGHLKEWLENAGVNINDIPTMTPSQVFELIEKVPELAKFYNESGNYDIEVNGNISESYTEGSRITGCGKIVFGKNAFESMLTLGTHIIHETKHAWDLLHFITKRFDKYGPTTKFNIVEFRAYSYELKYSLPIYNETGVNGYEHYYNLLEEEGLNPMDFLED